jgi:hypothetical protein
LILIANVTPFGCVAEWFKLFGHDLHLHRRGDHLDDASPSDGTAGCVPDSDTARELSQSGSANRCRVGCLTETCCHPVYFQLEVRNSVILVLLLMIASIVLVFLGLMTDITIRTQGTSPYVHMVLTYAGLLLTLFAHMVAFMYIIGLRKLLLAKPPDDDADSHWSEENY